MVRNKRKIAVAVLAFGFIIVHLHD
jgi:hypothetical protein